MAEYISIYAAIIATSTFIWNVAVWLLNKRKLKLECEFVVIRGTREFPYPGEFIQYKIINSSDKSLRVGSISGTLKTPNGKGYFTLASPDIPQTINPMDSGVFYRPAPDVFDDSLRSLYIEDSIGRKYRLQRSKLRKLKRKGREYAGVYNGVEDIAAYNPPLSKIE